MANNFYQIGDDSFMLDGAVSGYAAGLTQTQAVDKTWSALAAGGAKAPQYMLIGHDHGDHSMDALAWAAKFPTAKVLGPKTLCDKFTDAKLGNCTTLTPEMSNGNYSFKMGERTQVAGALAARRLQFLYA